jgi:hypothetical protein
VTLRNALLPYYHSLKIDMAIQGHDHVYNTIGPVDNLTKTVVSNSVNNLGSVPIVTPSNANGKMGGTFDVSQGTFYFINNSASRKKYTPTTQSSMDSKASVTEVANYWSLFTGRFGQTGESTYSIIRITTDTIFINTYAIDKNENEYLFDQIKVTKETPTKVEQTQNDQLKIVVDSDKNQIKLIGCEVQRIDLYDLKGQLVAEKKNSNFISTTALVKGIYVVRIYNEYGVYNRKIFIS